MIMIIIIIKIITYFMQQSPSSEANWFSASQEIPRNLMNPNVHYRIHKLVPVTTARSGWRKRPPIWRVAADILNKQSRTFDKGWSSSLGVGRGADNSSP
jgi:hypothetical protein